MSLLFPTVTTTTLPDDSMADHHYPMDEGSGSTLTDNIGTLDGTISGASWVTGSGGRGDAYLDFDGTDDRVSLGANSQSELSHFLNNGRGTIAGWVYVPSGTAEYIDFVATANTSIENAMQFRAGDDSTRFLLADGSNYIVDFSGSLGTIDGWTPLMAVLDGTDGYIYSGTSVTQRATGSLSTASGDFGSNVYIGAAHGTGTNYFPGNIDDVWFDSTETSTSDLQDWVDDTKGNYGL